MTKPLAPFDPELVWQLRRELASWLREIAADEDPRVAQRLRRIADAFETGGKDPLT